MAGSDAYTQQLMALLPRGQAWPRQAGTLLHRLLSAIGIEFARIDARADDIVNEADARTTLEMMQDWERVLGLPDECTGPADTLQDRRNRVVQKLTTIGGQSKAFFIELAAALGYDIEITEFRPFICGLSHCGENLNGGHDCRFNWRVTVPGPRATRFRTGSSQCGEKLLTIAHAEDLECVMSRLKPAHSNLIFDYQGE